MGISTNIFRMNMIRSSYDYAALYIVADISTSMGSCPHKAVNHTSYNSYFYLYIYHNNMADSTILFTRSRRGVVVSLLVPGAYRLFLDIIVDELVPRLPFISLRLRRSSCLCSSVQTRTFQAFFF